MRPNRMNRRSFLRTSAGMVAGGLAAPWISGYSYAAGDTPNEKPVVASIGVGGRGSGIGHEAAAFGKMVACADVHAGNAGNFAKAFGGKCEVHEDYRKILDRKDINAITCGTPDHWHVKVACDAMQAGKDLYCEKPLTLTIAEGRLVTRVATETKRVFQVGTQQRSEMSFIRAAAIARSGRLGTKLHAISDVGHADRRQDVWAPQPPPKELNWEFWLGQAPKVSFTPNRIGWNFRWWFEYSGGQVTDWGVHHTDIAVWALGGEDTGIVEAEGKGTYNLGRETMLDALLGKTPYEDLPAKYNVAVQFDCNLALPNGNTINLVSRGNDLTIGGEKGTIGVNRGNKLVGKPIDEIKKEGDGKWPKWVDEAVAKLYRGMPMRGGHMGNFFHCIKTRERPVSDVWTHVNSVNACHMANIAMLLGRKVKFDPAKYEFVGDAEANALARRKQRGPWSNNA